MTKIAIQIPDELQTFIDRSVETGAFHDADELLTSLLYDFKARNESDLTVDQQAKLVALRSEIQLGLGQAERGDFVDFNAGQIIREWHARTAA